MKVWIDQDACTGDGLCAEICPPVFGMHDDGLAYVKDIGQTMLCGPDGSPVFKGASGIVDVEPGLDEAVVESAEECPGECIYIEA